MIQGDKTVLHGEWLNLTTPQEMRDFITHKIAFGNFLSTTKGPFEYNNPDGFRWDDEKRQQALVELTMDFEGQLDNGQSWQNIQDRLGNLNALPAYRLLTRHWAVDIINLNLMIRIDAESFKRLGIGALILVALTGGENSHKVSALTTDVPATSVAQTEEGLLGGRVGVKSIESTIHIREGVGATIKDKRLSVISIDEGEGGGK